MDEDAVGPALDRLVAALGDPGAAGDPIGGGASPELVAALRAFIDADD
jgi:hypothetical protein